MNALDPLRRAEQHVRNETYASFGEEVMVLERALGLIPARSIPQLSTSGR